MADRVLTLSTHDGHSMGSIGLGLNLDVLRIAAALRDVFDGHSIYPQPFRVA